MIRVAHIDTGTTFRGGQKQVARLIRNLSGYNIEQLLLCPSKSPLKEKCEKYINKHYDLDSTNFMRFISRGDLVQTLKENRIDLLHAHDSHSHSLAGLLSPGGRRFKIIVTRRSSGRIGFGSKTKYLKHNIDYIAISKHIKDNLASGGVNQNKIHIIPDMLDLDHFKNMTSNHTNRTDDKIIVAAGAFDKGKGFNFIIEAGINLLKSRGDFILKLFGDGPEMPNYRRLIEKSNLGNKIILPGWVDDPLEYLTIADIFITASKSEGLNTSLLEAMASGLSIIASDIMPHRENIVDGENGLLFKNGSSGSLAREMNYLLDNYDSLSDLGPNACATVQKYDCKKLTDDIYNLYLQFVETKEI